MCDLDKILAASQRLATRVKHTPVSQDISIGQRSQAQVWFKWENQQTTGAFKLRGAFNVLLQLSKQQAQAGVLTASAGNHGLGLAYAAQQLGIAVTVYLPADAPQKKIHGLQALGATLVSVEGGYGQAERAALAAAAVSGATFVSAYNHPDVIAGAGSVGLEMLAQIPHLQTVLVPVGGGGLLAGVGLALKGQCPKTHLVGVQAKTSAVLYADWRGRGINAVSIEPGLADGLAGEVDPNSITRPLVKRLVDDFVLVSEDEIAQAIAYVHRQHDQTIEGAAAVGVAALLAKQVDVSGQVVGVLISGGNIDPQRHAKIIGA